MASRALLQSALRRMKESDAPAATLSPPHASRPDLCKTTGPTSSRAGLEPRNLSGISSENSGGEDDPGWKPELGKNHLATAVTAAAGDPSYAEISTSLGREGRRGVITGGIEMQDLEAALEGFSAESLRGAGLFESGVDWSDVGGLKAARSELREILEVRNCLPRIFCIVFFSISILYFLRICSCGSCGCCGSCGSFGSFCNFLV